jgi:hypothetical protein
MILDTKDFIYTGILIVQIAILIFIIYKDTRH